MKLWVLLVKVAKLRARVHIFKAKNVGPVMRLFKGPRPMTSKRAQARPKKPKKWIKEELMAEEEYRSSK